MTDEITFVSHTNKPGGGELALRRYLEATSLPVRLVTMEAGGVWEGLPCEVVPAPGVINLRRELRSGGLIVANSMRAAFLTALAAPLRAPLIYWVRDGLNDSAMSRVAITLTKQVTARRMSHYLANSEWTASTVREALQLDPESVDVVYSMCGVTKETMRDPSRTSAHDPLRLLFLGRLARWKAPDVAVRVLPVLRDQGVNATLTIAGGAHFGETTYVQELRSIVAAEPAATMAGHVEEIQALLAEHDILVHCSTVPEPFGQVIIQGLASGIPVVATAHGGPVEILNSAPVALLYNPGDVSSLAAVLRLALSRKTDVSQWAALRASQFTDEHVQQQTDAALELLHLNHPRGKTRKIHGRRAHRQRRHSNL